MPNGQDCRAAVTGGHGPLEHLLMHGGLYPVFQPIVSFNGSAVYAHEALIRGPHGTALHSPDALLRAATDEGLSLEFEFACVVVAMKEWGRRKLNDRLFVNVSAAVLMEIFARHGPQELLKLIKDFEILPRMLVLEITEHERVADMDQLAVVVSRLRSVGISLALDDFGDGRSSLRLWSQLRPEFVKIDKYFTKDISEHADKLKTIQALQQIAVTFDTELIAEGIETAQDLRVLRDLNIHYGQGYFLGYPDRGPISTVSADVVAVLEERSITVLPELKRALNAGQLRSLPLLDAETVSSYTTNDALAALFQAQPHLHAVALVEGQSPVGIINRTDFMNAYTKLYYREVWGRKSCAVHANLEPRVIERDHSVEDLIGILTSQDQRYLADGFIVTENGRYVGLGTGEQLVRSVTETRIEAARHANPLTFLPGNIPISQHMERLLKRGGSFVACYADLNHFKPFNDYYGYWKGDEMIKLVARIAMDQCDAQKDFLGHVGGDDFILLFQSADWRARCESIIQEFNAMATGLFDSNSREAGGIEAEDRHGVHRFFPFTTLSIGAIAIDGKKYTRAEQVANLAAVAKHSAKLAGGGLYEQPAVSLPGAQSA